MIEEMARACAKIYFRNRTPSLTVYNAYIKGFLRAYNPKVK